MYEMTAYCGLDCEHCPAYVATQKDDMAELGRVAAEWNKDFGMEIPAESIICDGCKANARICAYCSMCQVRSCGEERGIPTCAHCEEYVSGKLESLPVFTVSIGGAPSAKENLEEIRESLG